MKRNIYEFTCPNCGASGEAGIPADCRTLIDHGCGQLFIQQQPYGMFGKPSLVPVNLVIPAGTRIRVKKGIALWKTLK